MQGWPNNGNNKAPDASGNVTVADGDASYMSWLDGKPYLARKHRNLEQSLLMQY